MKKLTWALVALALLAVVAFSGCTGQDGKAYGSYDWYGGVLTSTLTSTGGFPSGATYNTYYSFSEGSYYVYYYIYYGSTYYPSSGYYYLTYTVTVNKGKLFSDGTDKYFDLYLGLSGGSVSGMNRVGAAPTAEQLASGVYSQTFSNGDVTITLNQKKVDASAVPKDEVLTISK